MSGSWTLGKLYTRGLQIKLIIYKNLGKTYAGIGGKVKEEAALLPAGSTWEGKLNPR